MCAPAIGAAGAGAGAGTAAALSAAIPNIVTGLATSMIGRRMQMDAQNKAAQRNFQLEKMARTRQVELRDAEIKRQNELAIQNREMLDKIRDESYDDKDKKIAEQRDETFEAYQDIIDAGGTTDQIATNPLGIMERANQVFEAKKKDKLNRLAKNLADIRGFNQAFSESGMDLNAMKSRLADNVSFARGSRQALPAEMDAVAVSPAQRAAIAGGASSPLGDLLAGAGQTMALYGLVSPSAIPTATRYQVRKGT